MPSVLPAKSRTVQANFTGRPVKFHLLSAHNLRSIWK